MCSPIRNTYHFKKNRHHCAATELMPQLNFTCSFDYEYFSQRSFLRILSYDLDYEDNTEQISSQIREAYSYEILEIEKSLIKKLAWFIVIIYALDFVLYENNFLCRYLIF